MDGKAILLTQGRLASHDAKTAHGLLRGTERYQVVAVIDDVHHGKDAGEVMDGRKLGIPVYQSLETFFDSATNADFLIIGVATKGGYIPDSMREVIREALSRGLSIVNGLHEFLADDHELLELADQSDVRLIDIRKPRPKSQLKFWQGSIKEVKCPIIPVMGTDCAVGKRTTARMLVQAARAQGLKSEMIFTGQTGWLQGNQYGFIFDSTYNDFVAGELESAIVSCYREVTPDIIFVEGQASLRNPTGPGGAEFLISGGANGVILQHAPGRIYYGDEPELGVIPPLSSEIDLVGMYGVETLAITLNTAGLNPEAADGHQNQLNEELGIPVYQPLKDGVAPIIPLILRLNA